MWAGGFPLFFETAQGARVVDVDGHSYIDLCLGDTGAMAGHAPEPTARAVERQIRRGTTVMLPSEDAAWVGRELVRRFGLDAWQFALTATDANRWALRMARELTGRPKVLVFNYCYHGTVDESVISLENGVARSRPGNVGPAVDPTVTTKVVEFNDLDGARAGARAGRRGVRPRRAGADQHRHRPARPRLPRGAARAHPRARHPADHRRDAHHQRRPRRLHRRLGARARHPHGRQGDRRRRADRRLRHAPRTGRQDHGSGRRPRGRRRRRRHPGRQRALAGRRPRDARARC